jgi:hypothetical protein
MGNVEAALQQLVDQRDRLNRAIEALGGIASGSSGRKGKKRILSAAARQKIAAAQRARWAKYRAAKK